MDERTRRTDDELAPNLRRPMLEPGVRSRSYSKFQIGVGAIVTILLVVAGYEAVHYLRPAPAPAGRFQGAAAQSVGAATVGPGNVRVIVNALGTVTPVATVTVQTQIDGKLTEVGFTEGQLVQKDDFLAQVDARPYEILKVPVRRNPCSRSRVARPSADGFEALPNARPTEFDCAPAGRGPSLHRPAI